MKKLAAVTAALALMGTAAVLAQQTPPAPTNPAAAPAAPAAATPAPPPDSPDRAARRALMRSTQQTVTQINEIVIGVMDPAGLKTRLNTLIENAGKVPALFGPNTDKNDVSAKPEIWTDQAGFKAINDKFIADAKVVLAAIPDRIKLAEGMRDLQANCAGCHTKYRVAPAAPEGGRGRGGRGRGAEAAAAPAAAPAAAAN